MSHRTARARALRRNATDAERALWRRLRNRRLQGHKFRRQVPLGRYVADFVCPARKLVIELDGGQHAARQPQDAARTAWLEGRGYRVLRFWNHEVLGNPEGVLTRILEALGRPPHPAGERESFPLPLWATGFTHLGCRLP